MKVLILSREFNADGGVVQVVSGIVRSLAAPFHPLHLPIGRRQRRAAVLEGALAPLRDNFNLVRRVLRERPDVVHLNASFNPNSLLRDGAFRLTLGLLRYRRVIVYFHGWDAAFMRRVAASRLLSSAVRGVFGKAAAVIVLSSEFKAQLTALGIPADRIHVMSTMFDGRLFRGDARQPSQGRTRLLFMSRLVAEKGVFETLEGFAAALQDGCDAELTVAGDGPARTAAEARAAALGIASRVTFTGYLRGEEKARVLEQSDVFVFPTRYPEGCPVVLLEAMAAGAYLVTSRAGGIADIVRDGEHGIVLEATDAESVRQALRRALEDPRREAIRAHNRQAAWQQFEAGRVTPRIEALYRRVGAMQA